MVNTDTYLLGNNDSSHWTKNPKSWRKAVSGTRESRTPKKQIKDKPEDFCSVDVLKASCNFLADKKDDQFCTKTWHGKEVDFGGWHQGSVTKKELKSKNDPQ